MFWKDSTGLPSFYKGWHLFIGGEQNNTTCKKLLQWLRDYLSVDTITLLLPVENQQNLAVYATFGLEEEIVQQIRIPVGQGFAGRIAAGNKPMIVYDLSTVEVVSPILRQKGLQTLVGVPLASRQGTNGVLHVGTLTPRQFTENDLQQLQLVAHRLSLGLADAGFLNFDYGCYNPKWDLQMFFWKSISWRKPVQSSLAFSVSY